MLVRGADDRGQGQCTDKYRSEESDPQNRLSTQKLHIERKRPVALPAAVRKV
jgi:hypothetical protein